MKFNVFHHWGWSGNADFVVLARVIVRFLVFYTSEKAAPNET